MPGYEIIDKKEFLAVKKIFDEGGVHQGSKPQFNDRMVVRYLYSIKKFN